MTTWDWIWIGFSTKLPKLLSTTKIFNPTTPSLQSSGTRTISAQNLAMIFGDLSLVLPTAPTPSSLWLRKTALTLETQNLPMLTTTPAGQMLEAFQPSLLDVSLLRPLEVFLLKPLEISLPKLREISLLQLLEVSLLKRLEVSHLNPLETILLKQL